MDLSQTQMLLTHSLEIDCSKESLDRTAAMIRRNHAISPKLAVAIYRNNVSGALNKTLETAYPACKRILGEKCFRGIALRYLAQTPSLSPDLNMYGNSFGDFLDNWTAHRDSWADFRYLGDLARLEWLWHSAYYKDDDPLFDFSTFAEASHYSSDRIRFQLSHALGLLRSAFPVLEVLELDRGNDDVREVEAGEVPEHLVIYRIDGQPRIDCVDQAIFDVLVACQRGATLKELTDANTLAGKLVTGCLPELIRNFWITGFTCDQESEMDLHNA